MIKARLSSSLKLTIWFTKSRVIICALPASFPKFPLCALRASATLAFLGPQTHLFLPAPAAWTPSPYDTAYGSPDQKPPLASLLSALVGCPSQMNIKQSLQWLLFILSSTDTWLWAPWGHRPWLPGSLWYSQGTKSSTQKTHEWMRANEQELWTLLQGVQFRATKAHSTFPHWGQNQHDVKANDTFKFLTYLDSQKGCSRPLRGQDSSQASQNYWQSTPCKIPILHWDRTAENRPPWRHPLRSVPGCLKKTGRTHHRRVSIWKLLSSLVILNNYRKTHMYDIISVHGCSPQ